MSRKTLLLSCVATLLFGACTKKETGKTLWIYSSIYKDVIAEMEPLLAKQFPGVKFQWYQSGSENVASRVNAELASGKSQADLILTSDPFWYLELKQAGHLLKYASPTTKKLPEVFQDDSFSIVRMCIGVIAYNETAIAKATAPKSWKDLTDPKFKGKISMGNPLESGSSLSLTLQLADREGWGYFENLKKNQLLAAGGNSAIIQRMETKERPIGLLLLENVLDAKKKGSPLEIVYPTDGVVMVPSPIAILAKTSDPELSKKVYDYFFSTEMQKAILHGRMHSPTLVNEGPEGSPHFSQLWKSAFPWDAGLLNKLFQKRGETKKKFTELLQG